MQKSNSKTTGKTAQRSVPAVAEKSAHQKAFDAAMELFHKRDFAKAKQQFQAALEGNAKELVFPAKQHIAMCEQRLSKASVKLDTAEDQYNYAIALYNRRDLDAAQKHFEMALEAEDGDHIHYALALTLGMKRNIEGAVKHLSRAIEMEGRNRNAALNDPEFQELMQHAPIKELLTGAGAA
jgi:tetratricopeptide (TPR) repeat protein